MITIYGKTNCSYCSKAKMLLETIHVPYEFVDISKDHQAAQFLKDEGYKTVPQIFEDGLHIGGFSDLNSRYLLNE